MNSPYILTVSGVKFHFLNPIPEEVNIEDIAYVLAGEYRFGGHCKPRITVAEHSVAVSVGSPKEYALSGLLHDATETYIRDIPSPMKKMEGFQSYIVIEQNIMRAIAERFELSYPISKIVKEIDQQAFTTEATTCINGELFSNLTTPLKGYEVIGWPPHVARLKFLQRFNKLTGIEDATY